MILSDAWRQEEYFLSSGTPNSLPLIHVINKNSMLTEKVEFDVLSNSNQGLSDADWAKMKLQIRKAISFM